MIIEILDAAGNRRSANVRGGATLGAMLSSHRDVIRAVKVNGKFHRDWEEHIAGDRNDDRVTVVVKTEAEGFLGAVITAIVNVAIGTLISVLTPKPKKPNLNNRREESSAIAGLHNATETGSPLFYSFGINRIYGTVISSGVSVAPDGKSMRGRILYFMGLTDGFGIGGIDQILIDDQPVENHTDIQVDIRYGYADQPIIPGFENASQAFGDQRTFGNAAPIIYTSRSHSVNQLKPTITFSNFTEFNSKGAMRPQSCLIKVERKLTAASPDAFVEVPGSPFRLSGQTNSPVYFPLEITLAGPGAGDQWDLRFTKATPGDGPTVPPDPQLYNVEEVEFTARNYPKCALLALSNIPSADFPSLDSLRVSARVMGNVIPVPDGFGGWTRAWTRDRVWIARYIATHPEFGCGSGARRELPQRVMTKAEFPGLIDNPRSLL